MSSRVFATAGPGVRRGWKPAACRTMLCFAAAVTALFLPAGRAQVLSPPAPPDVGIDQKLDAEVPLDLTFADEAGRPVRLGDLLQGKPAVLALVYYECPMLCGEVLQGMLEAFNALDFTIGREYQVLTVSFDPREKSDLAALKKKNLIEHYKQPGAGAGWHFLTGGEADIRRLADTVGFRYEYVPATEQFAHAAGIMVLTPEGKVSRYFYGIEYPERDLRFGLIEASRGRIGSLTDSLLLLCYHYDPVSGTYGFVVMRAVRIAGAATVLAIGALVALLVAQDRRKRRRTGAELSQGRPVPTR